MHSASDAHEDEQDEYIFGKFIEITESWFYHEEIYKFLDRWKHCANSNGVYFYE